MPLITIDKNKDKLFIAICKKGNHSFLMLGVYEGNQVTQVLCRVGKVFDSGENYGFKNCFSLFFHGVGVIQDEGVLRKKGESISYQAYELKYQQYLEFIQILEGLQIKNPKYKYRCFKPLPKIESEEHPELKEHEVSLDLTRDIRLPPRTNLDELHTVTNVIGVDNNCRHGAIKLVEEVQKVTKSPLVSSHFFIDLPYHTDLIEGKPCAETPFYVLPASPEAYPDLSKEKTAIATKLYTRMEHMLLIDPCSLQTQKKFESLKELYAELIGPQKDLPLDKLLLSIQTWKETNKEHLNTLRETFLWDYLFTRQSATRKLIDEIEHDLKVQLQ